MIVQQILSFGLGTGQLGLIKAASTRDLGYGVNLALLFTSLSPFPSLLVLCNLRSPSAEFSFPWIRLRVLAAVVSVRLASVPYCTSGPHLELKG